MCSDCSLWMKLELLGLLWKKEWMRLRMVLRTLGFIPRIGVKWFRQDEDDAVLTQMLAYFPQCLLGCLPIYRTFLYASFVYNFAIQIKLGSRSPRNFAINITVYYLLVHRIYLIRRKRYVSEFDESNDSLNCWSMSWEEEEEKEINKLQCDQ